MADLILSYHRIRVSTEDLSAGSVSLDGLQKEAFYAVTWIKLVGIFSKWAIEFPDAVLFLQRTDRESLQPVPLGAQMSELLRTDPVSFIRCTTITLHEPRKPKTEVVIDVGYDTLANSFGDVVYSRKQDDKVECPCCRDMTTIIDNEVCCCRLSGPQKLHNVSDRWAGYSVRSLLGSCATSFYFPRPWNTSGEWISLDDLAELYNMYLKEKSNV